MSYLAHPEVRGWLRPYVPPCEKLKMIQTQFVHPHFPQGMPLNETLLTLALILYIGYYLIIG